MFKCASKHLNSPSLPLKATSAARPRILARISTPESRAAQLTTPPPGAELEREAARTSTWTPGQEPEPEPSGENPSSR